jgi:hypothetical protein
MKPLIKWIDGKYLKEELPKREGHFIQVVRKGDVESALILLFEMIRKPLTKRQQMYEEIIQEDRERIVKDIDEAFKRITTTNPNDLRRKQ